MEIGAVKQAFNNEVIQLKKNLNQAKIQTIHKLTRKAKTLTEKKCSEVVKEKFKRKAESAVREVLIIKKIKPRDIARFIVTHNGNLQEFLNKPNVDNNKACARLLLHKALSSKYKLIRDRFANVSINDLLMSRQERIQLKKEAKEKQQNKKKKRGNSETDNVGGVWDVEDNNEQETQFEATKDSVVSDDTASEEENNIDEESITEKETQNVDAIEMTVKKNVSKPVQLQHKTEILKNNSIAEQSSDFTDVEKEVVPNCVDDDNDDRLEILKVDNVTNSVKPKILKNRKSEKRQKDRNKNLNEKLKKRTFNAVLNNNMDPKTKIVDPFFITSSGENYISLVEPRQPDEVKEVHSQGNRQYRRAVMFGLVPKPRKNNRSYEDNNFKQNGFNNNRDNFKVSTNKDHSIFKNKDSEMKSDQDPIPEKLHPSWEAKKRQSIIVPFEGKKIMFDDS